MTSSVALITLVAKADLENLGTGVRVAAVIATALMLGVVLELVRRRRLVERYALVWMTVALVLLVLAIWTEPLKLATDALGIQVPVNTLFLAAFGVAFLLLLHFSVITTRLSEETKILAQEVARLDEELRASRAATNGAGETGARPRTAGSGPQAQSPSSLSTTDQ
jgi:hypothetical protein